MCHFLSVQKLSCNTMVNATQHKSLAVACFQCKQLGWYTIRANSWACCFLSVQAAPLVHLSQRKQLYCCFPQIQTARLVQFSNFISVQTVELALTLSADSSGDTRVVRFYRFKQLGWLFIICENSSVGTLR